MQKIAIFGVGLTFDQYYNMLKHKYDICCIVDNDNRKWGKKYRGIPCESPASLCGRKIDKIIILTMWDRYINEIRKQLEEMGLGDKVVSIRDIQTWVEYEKIYQAMSYTDDFENEILIEEGCSINHISALFYGSNNHIIIHRNVRTIDSILCTCRGENCQIEIGDGTSIIGLSIEVAEAGAVKIGEDCMLADAISIMQTASHPIYDLDSRKRINNSKNVEIAKHVWIGRNATLLTGFSIGEGSIIGYGAISSSSFGNNCTIAGNPARILKENVTWKREAVGYEGYFSM